MWQPSPGDGLNGADMVGMSMMGTPLAGNASGLGYGIPRPYNLPGSRGTAHGISGSVHGEMARSIGSGLQGFVATFRRVEAPDRPLFFSPMSPFISSRWRVTSPSGFTCL